MELVLKKKKQPATETPSHKPTIETKKTPSQRNVNAITPSMTPEESKELFRRVCQDEKAAEQAFIKWNKIMNYEGDDKDIKQWRKCLNAKSTDGKSAHKYYEDLVDDKNAETRPQMFREMTKGSDNQQKDFAAGMALYAIIASGLTVKMQIDQEISEQHFNYSKGSHGFTSWLERKINFDIKKWKELLKTAE